MKVYNTRTENSKDCWETPWYFYELIAKKWEFTLDPCASDENHKCEKYYTIETDGYLQSWKGEIVFCNPPYSNNKEWIEKCYDEGQKDNTTVVLLMPNRTDTQYWHDYCMKAYEIYLIKGRISFELNGKKQGSPNFGSVLVVFKKHDYKYPLLKPFYHKKKDLELIENN